MTSSVGARKLILFGLNSLRVAELHGNMTQLQRMHALESFTNGSADFLVATDLAGRGLDIPAVESVINYELPANMKTYVHRVGRTARAGRGGCAVSFVGERDRAFLKQVLKHASEVVRQRTVPPIQWRRAEGKLRRLAHRIEETGQRFVWQCA